MTNADSATATRLNQIAMLRRLPAQIAHLIAGMDAAELTTPFLPGEWSIAQNVHHLADSHMNSYLRCKLIMTEEEPTLKPYDQDRWAALPDAAGGDVEASLALLQGLHARWVHFWESLEEGDWARTGYHPVAGIVTLADQLRLYAAHGESHIDQVRRTAAAQYAERPATQAALLARIDREWERFTGLLAHLDEEAMATPLADGWTPKAHVAHISAWEQYMTHHLVGGQPAHVAMGVEAALFAADDVDAINAVVEARSRALPVAAVRAAAEATHTAARAAVATLDWGAAGGSRLAAIGDNTYGHYLEHWLLLPVR